MLMSLIYVYLQTGDPLAGNDVIRHSFLWRDLVAVPLSPATAWWVMLGFFVPGKYTGSNQANVGNGGIGDEAFEITLFNRNNTGIHDANYS